MTVKPQFKRALALPAAALATVIYLSTAPLPAFSQKKLAPDSIVHSIEMKVAAGDSLLAAKKVNEATTVYFEAARAYNDAGMQYESQKVYLKIDEIAATIQKTRVRENGGAPPPLQTDNLDAIEAGKKYAEFSKLVENGDRKTSAGDCKGAMEDYRKATGMADSLDGKYGKEIAGAHYKLGMAFSSLREYRKAIECFPKAMALDSAGLIDYYEGIAAAHLGAGQWKKAINDYKVEIWLREQEYWAARMKGGKGKQAKMDQIRHKTMLVHNKIGLVYMEHKKYGKAIKLLGKALQLEETPLGYLNRGVAHFLKGGRPNRFDAEKDFEDAEGMLGDSREKRKLALAESPGALCIIYNNRGELYLKEGESKRAIAELERAVYIDSNYAMAYYNLGRAYSRMGVKKGEANADSAKATECYLTAIEKYKHEIELFTEEKALEKRKVPLSPAQKAWLADARKARYFQLAKVYCDLGKACSEQGKKDEAKTARKNARECNKQARECKKYAGNPQKGKKH